MTPEQQKALTFAKARQRQAQAFAQRAVGMSPQDLSIARSKNDAFGEYLRNEAVKPREGESEDARFKRLYGSTGYEKEEIGAVEGMARAGLQGLSFAAGDEAVAGLSAGIHSLKDGQSFDKLYEAYLDRERGKIEQFREESPYLAYGSEATGGIATGLATGGATTGSLGARMMQGAGQGAWQGGAYGFNAGEGGFGNRAKSGGVGAGIGGVLGAAAEPVSDAVKGVVGKYMSGKARNDVSKLLPDDLEMGAPEYDILARNVLDDPNAATRGAQNIRNAGPTAMLADADPYYAQLLDESISTGGRGGAVARQAIDDRVSQVGQSLNQSMDDVLGVPQGVKTAMKKTAQATAGARGDAYEQAYNIPIDYASPEGQAVEEVFNRLSGPHVRQAINEANARMKWDGRQFQIMAKVADDGTVSFEKMPGVLELDYIKRALGDLGFSPGGPKLAKDQATALRDVLAKAVPDYEAALGLGQDNILRKQAIEAGGNALRPGVTRETFAESVERMRPEDLALARQGVRSYIDDTLANVKMAMSDHDVDARESAKLLKDLSSRSSREKLAMILDPQEAKSLFGQLDEAGRAFEMKAAVAQNSKTQPRKVMQSIKQEAASNKLDSLLSGRPIQAAQETVADLTGNSSRAKQLRMDEIDESLAQILTRVKGDKAERLLQVLGQRAPQADSVPKKTKELARMLLAAPAGVTGGTWDYPRTLLGVR